MSSKNMSFIGQKVAVELVTGERLIGLIVEPTKEGKQKIKGFFGDSTSEGFWLMREQHFSYLSNETVKNIRLALPNEKEIDFKE